VTIQQAVQADGQSAGFLSGRRVSVILMPIEPVINFKQVSPLRSFNST
jgi:hypothetical protein